MLLQRDSTSRRAAGGGRSQGRPSGGRCALWPCTHSEAPDCTAASAAAVAVSVPLLAAAVATLDDAQHRAARRELATCDVPALLTTVTATAPPSAAPTAVPGNERSTLSSPLPAAQLLRPATSSALPSPQPVATPTDGRSC